MQIIKTTKAQDTLFKEAPRRRMKRVKIYAPSAFLLFIFLLLGCSDQNNSNNTQTKFADLILRNGSIYTVNQAQPWAEAIAIKNGRISYVGDETGLEVFIGKKTEVVDLKGKFVLPGFQDAHVHPLEGVSLSTFLGCDLVALREKSPNPEDWIEDLKKCNDIDFPHDWILGGGHDIRNLLTLERPPREVLDEVFPDKPAALIEKSSHSTWVNSKALEMMGITRDTPDPIGGIIFKDPKTGEPNGILSDNASDQVIHFALKKTPKLQQARYEALLTSQDYLVEHGITSSTNARVYWDRGNHEPWLRAEKEGTLKNRSIMAIWAYPDKADDMQLPIIKSMYTNDKNSLLRWSMVKFYSDGLVQNNSAAVHEKYNYFVNPEAQPYGLNYFDEKRLAKYITELEKTGFDVHIHAIGDRGVTESLNAIEAAQKNNPNLVSQRRHQITHVEVCRPADILRFGQLGVAANIQINFELSGEVGVSHLAHRHIDYENIKADDPDLYFKILGDIEVVFSPVLEIAEAGGLMVLSSDWDVASINPLVSIKSMVLRNQEKKSKEELIAFAIKAYTLNAAYVMHHDDTTGSLEVGKWADIAVIDKNIFEVSVEEIDKAKVVWTLLGGEEMYRAEGF